MARELTLSLALALAACGALAGCTKTQAPTASCKVDAETVACVDGVALGRAFVEQFVQEPAWIPGNAALPDARREALGRAVRTEIFRAEAKRRGLALPKGAPDAPASWAQALVQEEMLKRGVTRESIPDDEARRHYEQNRENFNRVDEVEAQVIAFATADAASKVYPEAAKADAAGFTALVAAHSVDEKTRSQGGDRKIVASSDENRTLLKVALGTRKPGVVAGPFQTSDGRWWLLRIKKSPVEVGKPFDDVMKATVRNAMLDARRRALLDTLEAALKPGRKIEVFEPALAKVTVPDWQ